MSNDRFEELARRLAERTEQLRSGAAVPVARKPAKAAPRLFDAITRDSHLQRIRYLASAYKLKWLVDQETFNRSGLDSLDDHELVKLHEDMDRAMDCIRDGTPFDDAGLVRPQSRAVAS